MVVDLVLKTRVAASVCTLLPLQDDRSAIWHDQSSPYQKHTRLAEGDLTIINPDQSCSLGDKLRPASRRIKNRFCNLGCRDLRKLPLFQRKAELKKIVDGTDVQFSESFEIGGREMFAHACKLGLEGVVSKARDGPYPQGRTSDWVKKTCVQRETLTIAGFALDEGKWDGIYVGRRRGKDLIYAGKVDHGFDKASAADLQKRLKPLIRKTQPYTKRVAHRGIWVEPRLLAEIEYRAKSAEGKVRHPIQD